MKTGRPTDYSKEIADEICERLLRPDSLRTVCNMDDMPAMATVCRWLAKHDEFREQYRAAREVQYQIIADETFEIVDDARNDFMTITTRGGEEKEVPNTELVARSRLRFDQRRWWLSKLAPKTYGDRIEVEDGPERTSTLNAFLGNIRKGEDAE